VQAFSDATNSSNLASSAQQIQFPDTSQLVNICQQLLGGNAFTGGLMAAGDPTANGATGSLVTGGQTFIDQLCAMMGGAGVGTTPQSITAGAQDVQTAVNNNPMASGTIAMAPGGPSGNTALDAINGAIELMNTLYAIISACGCAGSNAPTNVTPSVMIDTAQNTADAVTGSPMASGILSMGQTPTSGNVALDAINGLQAFADTLYSIIQLCGVCFPGVSGSSAMYTQQLLGTTPSFSQSVSPDDIINATQATVDAFNANPYAKMVMKMAGPGSGNLAIDALTGGNRAAQQLTAGQTHAAALTTAQSVNLLNQNLLVSQQFGDPATVAAQANWSYDANKGATALGCAKCVCNGSQDPLISGEVAVVLGETIEVACEVAWTGLTYTGTQPIVLAVEKYRRAKPPTGSGVTYLDVGWYDVAHITSPASSSGVGFVGIAGTYVVESGVDQVRFRLDPAKTITAGTVWFDDAELLKTDLIASECVPGVGLTMDNIVTQLYGTAGEGFTHNQEAVALANTASSITGLAAEIAALRAEGATGAVAGDDFTWTGSLYSNANWHDWGVGAQSAGIGYIANGSDAIWTPPASNPTTDIYSRFQWVGTDNVSTTDYQTVQVVLQSAPVSGEYRTLNIFVWIYHEEPGYIQLFGRMNSTGNTYCYAQFGSNTARGSTTGTYEVGYVSAGTKHVLTSGTCAIPGTGSTLTFTCGDKATSNIYHFRLEVGTLVIADFNDSSFASPTGVAQRGWGWGGYASSVGSAQGAPASIHQWLGMDQ